jgi:phosphonate transport system substrate-binding protein
MPSKLCSLAAATAAAMTAVCVCAGNAHAQECLNWGDLDKKLYCDEGRDLVADTPSQGYRLRDPETLVFSYVPLENASIDEKAFAEFMQHLAKTTGKKVRWADARSSAEQIKAMRDGQVQVAGVAPGPTVYAVNLAGYVPIAVMCRDDGTFDYKLQLIARKDSKIRSPDDLGNRKVAYVSTLSNMADFNAEGARIVYSGSQGKSIDGVVNREYDAAVVNSNDLERMQMKGGAYANDLSIVWESQPYPSTSFGFAYDLAPDLQRKIHAAFLTFDWEGTGLAREFGEQAGEFCAISYKESWESIRLLQEENGVTYDINQL